jgi:hypothetical protein
VKSKTNKTGRSTTMAMMNERIRDKLETLRARYDYGAVSAALYAVIKRLEIEIAWREYANKQEKEQGGGNDARNI